MTLQHRINEIRVNAQLTQNELSVASGFSRVSINKMCSGKLETFKRESSQGHMLKVLDTLEMLIKSGKLPLDEGKTLEQRISAMEKIKAFVASKK